MYLLIYHGVVISRVRNTTDVASGFANANMTNVKMEIVKKSIINGRKYINVQQQQIYILTLTA